MDSKDLVNRSVNAIRFLSADGVQQANSGHPGLPMGTAAIAYTIWMRHLHHNPKNPGWINRDRFILSGGHGSMLLYSLLYLTGYGLTLDELKSFRQWGTRTPGHPEYGVTPGIDTTTGPLGQGLSNGVGMAIAEAQLAAEFNQADAAIIDNTIYGIVTDGDLMEGVASEAASLGGHLKLGKIIYLYDDNRVSIDGSTDIAFTEDRAARFAAYGWHIQYVADGNDVDEIDQAIQKAKSDPRPSLIVCRTHIGYGLPTRQDTAKAHGEPPGDEELNGAKQKLGWPVEPRFYVPDDVLAHFRTSVEKGEALEKVWQETWKKYQKAHPENAAEFERRISGKLPSGWEKSLPEFPADAKGIATRVASGKVINAIAPKLHEMIGGSADLTPSNNTWIQESKSFQADNHLGKNIHFGVREHGMGAVVNGLSYYKGFRPYGATFLVFSDYLRPAIRISALSHLPSVWVFTHDSIGLGEDGPTHQPIEHFASLRAIPNLVTLRPADANETTVAWKVALERQDGPTTLFLTRQAVPTFDRSQVAPASGVEKGAYILADLGNKKPSVILLASGSEVSLVYEAGKKLAEEGVGVRIVSFPSWELFEKQDKVYQQQVLPEDVPLRLAVEMGISQGWERYIGAKGKVISIEHFGASAPIKVLLEKFGFTVDNVLKKVHELLGK